MENRKKDLRALKPSCIVQPAKIRLKKGSELQRSERSLSKTKVHRCYGQKLTEYSNGEAVFAWEGKWIWCATVKEAQAYLERKRKADRRIIYQKLYPKYPTIR